MILTKSDEQVYRSRKRELKRDKRLKLPETNTLSISEMILWPAIQAVPADGGCRPNKL